MSGLVELARRYVACSDELESLRDQIKLAVVNGGGAIVTARSGAKSSHPHIKAAAEAEAKILELIRDQPLKTSEIAKATGAKVNTVTERMKRLRDKGMATNSDSGWRASA